ncbi:MAG: magnesium transporter CorA, partial [Desulfuromusa sp.]|nr:magnesium transporter CorA [Desulfuromusa sp.]
MLNVRSVRKGHLVECTIDNAGQLESEALWIDLKTPSDEERNWIKTVYGQELATEESIDEIEASSRFYEDEHGLHLRSYFLRPVG